MSAAAEPIPAFLDNKTVDFPDGTCYVLLDPLTNYRSCHDGTPSESRMVFACKSAANDEEYIMKVKVQLPAEGQPPVEGPSSTTAAELVALEKFRDAKLTCAPHLVSFKKVPQGSEFPFPGGFVTYTVMTKMPGSSLFGTYWNMPGGEREAIVKGALDALRSIYALGIEPVDRGMRNVIWDPTTKHCSIIDFELWNEVSETFKDDTQEMQRWGLVRRPPPKDWFMEWAYQYR
ncbi:hypothetical protein H2198_009409 [Neophaeococcomyces mojaviensis]|uniref:Uncharacterized protein n=1 Tax=Neophaeococcomyces mojaviensis TaxID=3383035 RepID=A0ACC2ZUS3_9EURO|nr:hypothetical protein H2198_009409 [Knufia sp. JES_112]